jgi:hypothetical protein
LLNLGEDEEKEWADGQMSGKFFSASSSIGRAAFS